MANRRPIYLVGINVEAPEAREAALTGDYTASIYLSLLALAREQLARICGWSFVEQAEDDDPTLWHVSTQRVIPEGTEIEVRVQVATDAYEIVAVATLVWP